MLRLYLSWQTFLDIGVSLVGGKTAGLGSCLWCRVRMLSHIVVVVVETQTVDIVVETAKAIGKHVRHIDTAEAATFHHLLQFQVWVKISCFGIDKLLNLCGNTTVAFLSQFAIFFDHNFFVFPNIRENSCTTPLRLPQYPRE